MGETELEAFGSAGGKGFTSVRRRYAPGCGLESDSGLQPTLARLRRPSHRAAPPLPVPCVVAALHRVSAVKVCVTRPGEPGSVLIEAMQIFPDGSNRTRGRPLSEKVLPHEAPLDAARRGVLEELGPALGDAQEAAITLDESTLESWVEIQDSRSYPCLPTRYLLFSVHAEVSHIPAGPFTTLENCADTVVAAAAASPMRQSRRWRRQKKSSVPGGSGSISGAPATAMGGSQSPASGVRAGGASHSGSGSHQAVGATRLAAPPMATRPLNVAIEKAKPLEVFSLSGRPLVLPDELLHVWQWVPACQLLPGHSWQAGGGRPVDALGFNVVTDEAIFEFDDSAFDALPYAVETAFVEEEPEEVHASEGTRAAAMSEDTGGCIMYVDPDGRYSIVCSNDELYDA